MRSVRQSSILFLIMVFCIPFSLLAEVLVVQPSKDNTIYPPEPFGVLRSNGLGIFVFAGRTNEAFTISQRRALLAFDLSQVPPGSVIHSVELEMSHFHPPTGPLLPFNVSLHRALKDWGEGTSNAPDGQEGKGVPATPDSVTWSHTFFATNFWDTAGGDFAANASAATAVEGVLSTIVPITFSGGSMVSDVQGWVNDPSTNFGWFLVGDETRNGTAKRFTSREHPNASTHPTLTIDFTPAGMTVPGVIAFAEQSLSVDESAGEAILEVTRTGGDDGAVSAMITTEDGTATAGEDYTALALQVMFADGESGSKTVALPVLGDSEGEEDETLLARLSTPTGGATLGANATLPITIVDDDLSESLYFAQFGNGEGFVSQIFLVATGTDAPVMARLDVRNDDGSAFETALNGMPLVDGSLEVEVPPNGTVVLATDGLGTVATGSVTVSADGPLGGVILFGGPTGLAGVGGSQPLTSFLVPVEVDAERGSNTGVSLQNIEDFEVTVELSLRDAQGNEAGTAQIVLPPRGHLARFVTEFEIEGVDFSDFQGSLAATSSGRIASTPLQQRPGQLATLPVLEN